MGVPDSSRTPLFHSGFHLPFRTGGIAISSYMILGMVVLFIISFRHYFPLYREMAETEVTDVL